MTQEAAVITAFYDAFSRHDAEALVACYADDVVFRDPAFGELHGEQAKDMWRMLIRAGKDLAVTATGISGGDGRGQARWEADYTFATGRKVHNRVEASFEIREGLITRHTDQFDFARWAGQAFGPAGGILGHVPLLPFAFQRVTRWQLSRYSAARKRRR